MSFSSGLAGIRKAKEEAAARRAAFETPKADWFKLSGNPNGRKVYFLQELDEDSETYDAARGVVLVAVEHQAPGKEGWKARATCTFEDEGRCYACEMHKRNPQDGWKQKTSIYINVLDEDGKVKVLSRNVNNGFVENLVEWFNESGSITRNAFKLKETGEGFNRTWTMTPTQLDLDPTQVELYDLHKVVLRNIPYDEQEQYYGRVYDATTNKEKESSSEQSEDPGLTSW